MNVNVHKIIGSWNIGYSLDKHTIRSTYIGDDQYGHARFDTTRTEIGEALYQLKYNSDRSRVNMLAQQIFSSLGGYFPSASFIVPMPPSKYRVFQPVTEIAKQVAVLMNIPCREDVLIKTTYTDQVKNIPLKEDRVKTLCSTFKVNDILADGKYDVLIVDDLYDTGSSLEAATMRLRNYQKIQNVFVITITRKNP